MKNMPNNKIQDRFSKPEYMLPGWYSDKDFVDLYEKEIRRSYRSDLPLTLLTINIEAVSNLKHKNQDKIYHDLLNKLILVVTNTLRDEDITHLDADNLISILLINTSLEDARIVKNKIMIHLSAIYKMSYGNDFSNILKKIEFNSLPLNIEQEMVN